MQRAASLSEGRGDRARAEAGGWVADATDRGGATAGDGGAGNGDIAEIPAEDVVLVATQAGVSENMALEALRECNGEPAEAIIQLMED